MLKKLVHPAYLLRFLSPTIPVFHYQFNLTIMNTDTKTIFSITENDIQIEAKKLIGRKLTADEIQVAKKGLESGILTGIDIIYKTILLEMIKK